MPTTSPSNEKLPLFGKSLRHAKWTIIIFMAAESDLGEDFKDIYDQIAGVGSNEGEVNFVVIFDGLNTYMRQGDNGKVTVYYVRRNSFYSEVTDNSQFEERFEQDNLTNTDNLEKVLAWVKGHFSADQYGFIYLGHGGQNPDINNGVFIRTRTFRKLIRGKEETDAQFDQRARRSINRKDKDDWDYLGPVIQHNPPVGGNGLQTASSRPETVLMVLFQNNTKGLKVLSYSDLGSVLKKVFNGKKGNDYELGFICLDCCWGQLIEHGLAFKDVTRYLVASPDEMPILGIGYEGFCHFLINRPEVKPSELADLIVSEYFQTEYNDYLGSPEFSHMGVSLTCIETTYMDDIIKLMTQLSNHLKDNLATHFYLVHMARLQCMAYTYQFDDDDFNMYNIDLIWFLENLQYYNHYNNNKEESDKPVDPDLDRIISNLLTKISLYYVKSYLASNYELRQPGENGSNGQKTTSGNKNGNGKTEMFFNPIVGGKGVGIFFPSRKRHFLESFYSNAKTKKWLSANWKWGEFVEEFVNYKEKILNKPDENFEEEMTIFKRVENLRFRRYLDYCDLSGSDEEHTLEEKLFHAAESVKLNIPHKWSKTP